MEYKYAKPNEETVLALSFTLTMWNINTGQAGQAYTVNGFYINYVEYK